jgi:hypothetical protein
MNFYFTVQFRFSAYAYMGARPEAMDFVQLNRPQEARPG